MGKLYSASTITGTRHIKKGEECEDVILVGERSDILFFGIADGQSKKKYCREGARAVLEIVMNHIINRGIEKLEKSEYMDELQYEFIHIIRELLIDLEKEYGASRQEFASTLMVFAYNSKTCAYMLIHLGDGAVIRKDKDGDIDILSPPENGSRLNETWLTTSKDALSHLRIGFGKIDNYRRVIMVSDGADSIIKGRNIQFLAKSVIDQKRQEDVIKFLENSNPVDDASCIVIDL